MTSSTTTRSRLPLSLALLLLALAGLVSLPGCSGCTGGGPNAAATKKKDEKKENVDEAEELIKKRTQKREKPKDDFEPLAVRMLPSNDPSPSIKQQQLLVKPGHWVALRETAKTNNFDFAGELAVFCEDQSSNLPLVVTDTTSRLWNWCPAMLPKGQNKWIEAMIYVPRRESYRGRVYSVRSELHGVRGGRTEMFSTAVSPSLRHYEHLIVVLAGGSSSPASYTHLDRLFSVRMPEVEATENETLRYYYVLRPTVDRTAPLPSHSLAWTTIAYIFWDDLDPAILSNQQQQALLDWLHWGGQLVISGPASLDKLKGSFLSPFLPGESTESVKLGPDAFQEINERYSLERNPLIVAQQPQPPKGQGLRRIVVSEDRPMIGVDLRLSPGGELIGGTGGLVAERRVGGGRVVVTRFPLADVRIRQWKNFDGFFNSVLLRRPGRVFKEYNLNLDFHWDDPNLEAMVLEARLGSTLRYFTRDIGWVAGEREPAQETTEAVANAPTTGGRARPRPGTGGGMSGASVYGAPGFTINRPGFEETPRVRAETSRNNPLIDDWHFAGYGASPPADLPVSTGAQMEPIGVAAWSDDAAASDAAREILTEAAGIEIPSADFVVKVLAVYLLVLVPLNGLLFWMLGKIEWAWITAPIIALVGAGAVIRLAQLDIGFARSRTEVAVLEVQGGYERAHLTRYTALYTSLSSSYSLAFDEPNALAIPFPAGKQDQSMLSIAKYSDVAFRRGGGTTLEGVQVSSNSTGMIHSEHMLSLGESAKTVETLRLVASEAGGFSVSNTTDLVLRDVAVLRRAVGPRASVGVSGKQVEIASVPKLDAASSAVLNFTEHGWSVIQGREGEEDREDPGRASWPKAWNEAPIFSLANSATPQDRDPGNTARIRLTRLARLAAQQLRLLPGDVRLIGWTDQSLPGMHISPEAPQNATYTLVIAHLARGSLPTPKPDRNVAEDYANPALFESEAEKADAEAGTSDNASAPNS